jgi:2-polyprenyl-6-methoxyphenol hydroxylase-like FAD-dependent oxidoreductase
MQNVLDKSSSQSHYDYVIGADGAHSVVRKAVGITFEGKEIFFGNFLKFQERNMKPKCPCVMPKSPGIWRQISSMHGPPLIS